MKELKWTDIWNKPFKYDYYGYVWGADGVMTFTVDDLTEENDKWMQEFCDNMVKALNDEECQKYPGLHIEEGCDLYIGERLIGYFRGWGHLVGGLNLDSEEAALLQDEMIQFIMDRISLKYETPEIIETVETESPHICSSSIACDGMTVETTGQEVVTYDFSNETFNHNWE